MLKNPKGPFFQIFRHYETVKNSLFFSKVFQRLQRFPFIFFEILQQNACLKNLKGPLFTVFGIVRNFKMDNFCLKIRFSEAQHAISDFFSEDRRFFYATFF